ncbi:MAG: glycogen synthase [Planctomycetes bacterium]|nr:glycogen synthase [Planctomycetota bacterium]
MELNSLDLLSALQDPATVSEDSPSESSSPLAASVPPSDTGTAGEDAAREELRAEEEERRAREEIREEARISREWEEAAIAQREADEAARRTEEFLAAQAAEAEREAREQSRLHQERSTALRSPAAPLPVAGKSQGVEKRPEVVAETPQSRPPVGEIPLRRPGSPASDPAAAAPSVPALEVENPFWEKPPEIFEALSGAPNGAAPYGYPGQAEEPTASLPVTMARSGEEEAAAAMAGDGYDGDDAVPVAAPGNTAPVPLEKRMYIVMITPEVAPCAKVGGLGDVVLGLGRELMKRGHGVEVISPMYAGMRYDLIGDLHEEYSELWCPHYTEWRPEKVFQGTVEGGLQVNFITGGTYTERPNIYGYEDDLQRFTYFSRQALEFMYKTNRRPEIIHCHDWATGLVPAILWDIYEKLGWNTSRVVYTIHNNECQGLCGFPDRLLALVGLDAKNYLRPDRMQDDSHRNCINMMKGGIIYSNFVTTVSPTYAGELKTVGGGRGLQTTIAKNSAKVGGVLNGIDYDFWNPQTDGKLAARYSVGDDFHQKYVNKKALREWLGLWDAWKPIIAVVTRLTQQKGLALIKHAIWSAKRLQSQFVLLGSAPDPKVNAEFVSLQHELKDDHDINLYLGYHEDLSRLIYAGSDLFLIPSLYEPCGLTQMISLRYGTVPVVRETGGLVDTVFDLDNSGLGLNDANGFTFRDPTPESLDYGLERAVRLWYDNPEAFNRLARNGMRYDYSWRHPAEHYENIYHYIKA